ncbi:MAG: O-antigen ligase family protein [Bacteroidaceae bacterium]
MKNSLIKKWKDHILVFLLIILSGSPTLGNPFVFATFGIIALSYSFLKTSYYERIDLWNYLLILCSIFVFQYFVLGAVSYLGSLNMLLKIVFGATVMWVLKDRFRYVFLNVMFFFAAISLVFYALCQIGFVIPNLFDVGINNRSIFLFVLNMTTIERNCGPFWEPGAYGCYLILVPLLFLNNLNWLIKSNKTRSVILLLAIITTLSTTTYICFAFIGLYYALIKVKNKFLVYIFIFPFLVYGIYCSFFEFDFLGKKILEQAENVKDQGNAFSNTRFGSFTFDLHYIKKHPLVGNGLIEKTRYADHPFLWGKSLGHGNGFSNYLAQIGIIAMLLYLFLMYKKIPFRKKDVVFFLFIIILLLQGEQLLNYPLYLSLPFVIYKKQKSRYLSKKRRIVCSKIKEDLCVYVAK